MSPEQAEKILKFYKSIPWEIEMRRQRIAELNDRYNPLRSVSTDGTPGAGYISDQTASTVIRIEDAGESAIAEIADTEAEIAILQAMQRDVFACVKHLPYFEKKVVHRFYWDRWRLSRIARELNYSERTCKRLKNSALKKLSQDFKSWPAMSPFLR